MGAIFHSMERHDRSRVSVMGEFRGNQHVTVGEDSQWTEAKLVEAVEALTTELGRPPTTSDTVADGRFPGLTRLYRVIDDWPTLLRKAGVEPTTQQCRSQPTDRRASMCEDLRRVTADVSGSHLTTRQYDAHGAFATSSIKERFGSWTDACAAAGVESGRKHGHRCRGPRGEALSSLHEQAVAEALFAHDIVYETHPTVPDTNWVADFYLPSVDIWLEVDGYAPGTRPNADGFAEKLGYYASNDLAYAVVTTAADVRLVLREHGLFTG